MIQLKKYLKNLILRNKILKNISLKLKQKKLTNIYSGRKLKLILQKD